MFKGTYWITEVTHSIRNNTISTSFTGTRIPTASLPDPRESTMATYRPLFDSIINKAIIKNNQSKIKLPVNEKSIVVQDGRTVIVDMGSGNTFNGETLVNRSGVNIFGVPYNGFSNNGTTGEKYIQLVENKNYSSPDQSYQWFRAAAVKMNGGIYKIDDDMTMGVINNILTDPKPKPLLWSEIKDKSSNSYFYGTRFLTLNISGDKIITANTKFINPKNNKEVIVSPSYDLSSTVKKAIGPVHVGPSLSGYGICMSDKLMRDLELFDGDIVYFKLY
jgi:hypothetical protein